MVILPDPAQPPPVMQPHLNHQQHPAVLIPAPAQPRAIPRLGNRERVLNRGYTTEKLTLRNAAALVVDAPPGEMMRREAEIQRLVKQDVEDMFIVRENVVRLGEALDMCKDMAHPIFVHKFFAAFVRDAMAEVEAALAPLLSEQGLILQPGEAKPQVDHLKKQFMPLMALQAAYEGQRAFAVFGESNPRVKINDVRQWLGLEALVFSQKRKR